MRSTGILVVAGGLCGLGLGCVARTDWEGVEGGDDEAEVVERAGSLEALCDPRVHIARRTTGCTKVTTESEASWLGEPLFDVGTPWLEDVDHAPVPGGLDEYCRYTWDGIGSPTPEDVTALHSVLGSATSPDCGAITAQADVLTDALGPTLREIFRAGAGWMSPEEVLPVGTEPRVTVVVVDSQPQDPQVEPTSTHGRSMVNIISDVACPDLHPSCGVELRLTVGLPRMADGQRNYVEGGIVGTHADLAVAIYEGVRRWEKANEGRSEPSHLIINLSLGWDPTLFEEEQGPMDTAIETVHAALEHAACKKALIIASAGNSRVQSNPHEASGPLLPAGWEIEPAPTWDRCTMFDVAQNGLVPGDYRPLVHAVGGLGIDLGPLPNARREANPRLVAVSAHAVAGQPPRGGATGTSVGTAVTSGTAALVWSHYPALEAHEVMDLVYAGAVVLPTNQPADFALGGTTPVTPRRVSACHALHAACLDAGGSCPIMPCQTRQPPPLTELESDLAELEAIVPVPPVAVDLTGSYSCNVGAGSVTVHALPNASPHCESLALGPEAELVNPTPESIGCPTCTIQNNGVLTLATHAYYADVAEERVMVALKDMNGATHRYDLGALQLSSQSYATVVLSPAPAAGVRSGEIAIDFAGEFDDVTTVDPLLVLVQ